MKRSTALAFSALLLMVPATPAQTSEAPVPEDIPIVLLVDLSTGQTLYSREENRRFVPASVTKVMTAYTAFKLVDEGKLRLDRATLYTEAMEDEWYNEGSNMFLLAGERPTVAQLLLGITTVSGNDASVALAIAAAGSLDKWLALMNANAAELGMNDTHFGSPNGYPDGGQTFTTARDLAVLGEAMTKRYPALYKRFFGHRTLSWRDITQGNHDPVTGRVDGADGLKTGYTNEAGFTFLGSAARDGRRLIVVVAGSPDSRTRDRASRELLEWGFDDFNRKTLLQAGAAIGHARIQDGADSEVPLMLATDYDIAIPKDGGGDLTAGDRWQVDIIYRGPIEAPVKKGDQIARLRLTVDGETVLEKPLQAAQDVPRANAFQRVLNAFGSWIA